MTEHDQLVQVLNKEFGIELSDKIALEEIKEKISGHINYLIQEDFQKLIFILYRIDISEDKLKLLLKDSPLNAADIITELIIERQLQKIASRRFYNNKGNDSVDENEKW
jgi:ABC-type antimicrobial peptide transport system ATPase subunit